MRSAPEITGESSPRVETEAEEAKWSGDQGDIRGVIGRGEGGSGNRELLIRRDESGEEVPLGEGGMRLILALEVLS